MLPDLHMLGHAHLLPSLIQTQFFLTSSCLGQAMVLISYGEICVYIYKRPSYRNVSVPKVWATAQK